jgi:hypothetical protein
MTLIVCLSGLQLEYGIRSLDLRVNTCLSRARMGVSQPQGGDTGSIRWTALSAQCPSDDDGHWSLVACDRGRREDVSDLFLRFSQSYKIVLASRGGKMISENLR